MKKEEKDLNNLKVLCRMLAQAYENPNTIKKSKSLVWFYGYCNRRTRKEIGGY